MNRTLGMVCARAGSKRLPGKNMLEYEGKPLTVRAYKTLEDAGCKFVICVTDIPDTGLKNVLHRPDYMSTDHTPLQTTIKWALRQLDQTGYVTRNFDTVAHLIPTNPFIKKTHIPFMVQKIRDEGLKIVRSYDMNSVENGLIVANLDYILNHWIDVYCGAVFTEGKEIHTQEDYDELCEHEGIEALEWPVEGTTSES